MNDRLAQETAGGLHLRVSAGPAARVTYPLSARPLVLGRESDTTELSADRNVSRRHAEVILSDQGPSLTDLGSSNGTYVNDTRVTGSAQLHAGDRIRIGQTELVVEAAGTARVPDSPAASDTQLFPTASPAPPSSSDRDWLEVGRGLYDHGDMRGSREAFEHALHAPGHDPGQGRGQAADASYGLGMVELAAFDRSQAVGWFRRAVREDPDHANAMFQLGVLAQDDGDLTLARKWYQQVLVVRPGHLGATKRLASLPVSHDPSVDPGAAPLVPPLERASVLVPVPSGLTGSAPGVMSMLEQDPSPISVQTVELIHQLDMSTRPSLIAQVGRHMFPLLILVGIALFLFVAITSNTDGSGSAFPMLLLLALLLGAVYGIALVKTTRYRIALGRLQIERGIFHRRLENVDLWRVLNVNLDRTLVNRMTGDGTLELLVTIEPTDLTRRSRRRPQVVRVTGLARGSELSHIHQCLLNIAFLLRGNPIVKGIIQ